MNCDGFPWGAMMGGPGIYIIADDELPIYGTAAFKVGRTRNMRQRLSVLQTGNPKRLHLIGWIDDYTSVTDAELEAAIHAKLPPQRRGEWWNTDLETVLRAVVAAGRGDLYIELTCAEHAWRALRLTDDDFRDFYGEPNEDGEYEYDAVMRIDLDNRADRPEETL